MMGRSTTTSTELVNASLVHIRISTPANRLSAVVSACIEILFLLRRRVCEPPSADGVRDFCVCFLIARSRDSPPPVWVDIPTGGVSRLPRQRQGRSGRRSPERLSFCANGPKHHPVLGTRRRLPPAALLIDHGHGHLDPYLIGTAIALPAHDKISCLRLNTSIVGARL
jgi:hypothetical protein